MKKTTKKESEALLRASVTKEMTKPRMAKSVREIETNSAAARIARLKARKYRLKLLLPPLPRGACS
jgi:hypothetical protein